MQSKSYTEGQLIPNGDISDTAFCDLIHQWFPDIHFDKVDYDERAFAQAISNERNKWNNNTLGNSIDKKKKILSKAKDQLLQLNLKFIRNKEKYFI